MSVTAVQVGRQVKRTEEVVPGQQPPKLDEKIEQDSESVVGQTRGPSEPVRQANLQTAAEARKIASSASPVQLLRAQLESQLPRDPHDTDGGLFHRAAVPKNRKPPGSPDGLFTDQEWDTIAALGGDFEYSTRDTARFSAYSDQAHLDVTNYLRGLARSEPFRDLSVSSWGPDSSPRGNKWTIMVYRGPARRH